MISPRQNRTKSSGRTYPRLFLFSNHFPNLFEQISDFDEPPQGFSEFPHGFSEAPMDFRNFCLFSQCPWVHRSAFGPKMGVPLGADRVPGAFSAGTLVSKKKTYSYLGVGIFRFGLDSVQRPQARELIG